MVPGLAASVLWLAEAVPAIIDRPDRHSCSPGRACRARGIPQACTGADRVPSGGIHHWQWHNGLCGKQSCQPGWKRSIRITGRCFISVRVSSQPLKGTPGRPLNGPSGKAGTCAMLCSIRGTGLLPDTQFLFCVDVRGPTTQRLSGLEEKRLSSVRCRIAHAALHMYQSVDCRLK